MNRDPHLREILSFIASPFCNVKTQVSGAVVSATQSPKGQDVSSEASRLTPRATPGGRSAQQLISQRALSTSDEARVWRKLVLKYISLASGDIAITAERDAMIRRDFMKGIVTAIIENPRIRSLNGVPKEFFRQLHELEVGKRKSVTALAIVNIANGKVIHTELANADRMIQRAKELS